VGPFTFFTPKMGPFTNKKKNNGTFSLFNQNNGTFSIKIKKMGPLADVPYIYISFTFQGLFLFFFSFFFSIHIFIFLWSGICFSFLPPFHPVPIIYPVVSTFFEFVMSLMNIILPTSHTPRRYTSKLNKENIYKKIEPVLGVIGGELVSTLALAR